MPYMAVRCSSCSMLQVKEVRTSTSSKTKWKCVICNQKQSLRKVYAKSDSSKDIRKFVQSLNLSLGSAAEEGGADATMESAGDPRAYRSSASFLSDQADDEGYREEAEDYGEPAASSRVRSDWSQCAEDWTAEEGCTEESPFPQSFQDDKIADSWCNDYGHPSGHFPRKRSHPLPPRTLQSLSAIKDCSTFGSFRSADSPGHAASLSRTENLLAKLKRGRNSRSGNRTTLRESFDSVPDPDEDSRTEMTSNVDGLPIRTIPMQKSTPGA